MKEIYTTLKKQNAVYSGIWLGKLRDSYNFTMDPAAHRDIKLKKRLSPWDAGKKEKEEGISAPREKHAQ